MNRYTISSSSSAGDLIPVGLAIHEILNHLPVTAMSRDK